MKRIISFLLIVAMLVGILPVSAYAESSGGVQQGTRHPFVDVAKGSWYEEYVRYVWEKGLFEGTSDTKYSPNRTLTRAMFVTALGRMEDIDREAYTETAFSDVKPDSWYGPYVAWAAKERITYGVGAEKFAPNEEVSREQMAVFIYRYLTNKGKTTEAGEPTYKDSKKISGYAVEAVSMCSALGIFKGDDHGNFNPWGNANRGEAAAVFARLYKYINNIDPEVTEPEATKPEVTEPEATKPEVTEPEATKPEVTEPEATKPEATEPEVTEPEATEPEVTEPEATEPEVTEYCKVVFAYPDGMDDTLKDNITMEASVAVEKGTLIYTLPLPEAVGYIFGGWYYDSALTQLVASEETVTENITLYPYLFESEAEDQVVNTPNFTSALDVSAQDYFVTIAAKDEETLRNALFIHSVTEGDVQREPVITDNGDGTYKVVPEGGFIAGGTYQFKALDRLDENIPAEDYIRFVENGEVLGASVQFYNITVAKEEYNALRLDDELKFISIDNVDDFSFDGTALVDLKLSEETFTTQENNAIGSFVYYGTDLQIGDIVGIHDGVVDAENPTAEHCDHMSYVRITDINENVYTYEIPEITDVIFTPEVLPVPKDVSEGVNLTTNDDGTFTLSLYNEYLDYSKYSNPVVNAQTDTDVGDFVALYQGQSMETSTAADFYEILAISEGSAVTELTLAAATTEDIQNSMGLYEKSALDLTLTEEEIADMEVQIAQQASESGFAEETAKYMAGMLANSGNSQMPEGFDPSSVCINVLDEDGNPISEYNTAHKGVEVEAGAYTFNVKLGKVDVEADITNFLQEVTAVNSDIGIRAELSVRVPLEIQQVLIGGTTQNPDGWNTVLSSLDLEITASFVQEFAIDVGLDADEHWDTWFIFPYISEVTVDIDLDVGTYTGVGVVVTMDTGAYQDAYDFENFISTFDSTYDPGNIKIGSLAKTLEEMMNDPYKFFGSEGESNSLLDDYREMMNDELEYVELLAIPIVKKKNFYITPNIKIVHIQLNIDAVISAKASINIGASFEHLDVNRYSFHIECFSKKSTQNVTRLQNGYTNFNFYAMGNIGLRIGGRVTIKVGLLSVKIANLGLMLETGPCLQMYGFFYFHYDKHDGREANMYHGGMYLIEIGWYLLFDFFGGAAMDIIGFNVHLVEEEWYFWKSGDGKFIVAPQYPVTNINIGGRWSAYVTNVGSLFTDVTRLKGVDIRTGDTFINYDMRLKDFDIVCTNPAFVMDADKGTISVTAPEDPLIQSLEGEIRLTYKHGTVPMSKTPIVSVIKLKWIKTYPYGIILFYDDSGNQLGDIEYEKWQKFTEGTHPTGIRYPAYTPPAGYDWDGSWHYRIYHPESYSYTYYPFDPNTYVMKDEILYVYPTITPRTDTPYKICHYIESLEKPDTYELYLTEEKIATTGDYRFNYDTITIEGFQYNRERSGGGYYYHPIYDMMFPEEPYNIIAGDGSTVIEYYYDRLSYSVWLETELSEFRWYSDLGGNSTYNRMAFGATIDESVFKDVEVPGYTFAGWRDNNVRSANLLSELPTITADSSYTAVWTPRDDTPYTVTYYIMQSDGNYEAVLTESFTGTTGATIDTKAIADAAIENNPELFKSVTYRYADDRGHYDPEQNYTILGGGYTKIGLYYNREYHRAYWYGLGDMPTMSYFYEGQQITPPEQIPEAPVGYNFSHWKGLPEEPLMGAEDRDFYPAFEGQEGIPYTVLHVRANLDNFCDEDDEFYTQAEVMYGKAGETPTVNYRSYEGFTAEPYEAGDTVIYGDGTLTVVVKYRRNSYSLTLDANGGTLSHYRSTYYYGIGFELPKATREGYTFVCWYLKGDPNETPVTEIDSFALTDLTYVVKWTADPISYKVEHYLENLDGSYAEPRVITLNSIINSEVTAQPEEFAGFTFDEGNALNVTTGFISDAEGNIVDADGNAIVLKLYYRRNSYVATWYDYDGTKLAEADFLYGAEITAPEAMAQPQRTGYTFANWKDFGTMGAENAVYYAETDALWNANTYTVSFNANGGTGDMQAQSFVYDVSQTLSANAFSYTNRNFMGWSTTPDGEVEYTNNQSVSNMTAENGGVVTLYAVWELIEGATAQYTIVHYTETLSGGYEKYSETTGYGLIEQERTVTAADAVSIVGFTFDPNAANVLTAIVKEDGSTLFEMYYSRNRYDLTLDFGDEQIKVAVEDENYNMHIVTKEEDPERAVADQVISVRYGEDLSAYLTALEDQVGYTFAGWDNSRTDMPAENILLTAQWTPVEVTVTFHPGTSWFFPEGTDLDAAAVTETYRYGEEVTLPEGLLEQFKSMFDNNSYVDSGWIFSTTQGSWPTLSHLPLILVEGYYVDNPEFREYATDEEGNYLYDENGDYIYTDTYSVLVAPFWSSSYDVVHFNANGGEGSMASMNVDAYGYRAMPICTFIREGYVFTGWNTAPDGSGTAYGIYDYFYGNSQDATTTTLYAQWEKVG